MSSIKVSKLFLNVSAIALGVSAIVAAPSAYAQVAEEKVETVIVTATGRAKAVQDIPVSLTAVTAASIQQAGITDVRNLQQVASSYRVETGQSNSAGTTISIRGIGTSASNPGFEGAVAVFIDGVYRSRSGSALTDLPKVDRIEVFNGPNGTLGGRNASAGMLSVFTSKPKFEREVYGAVDLGNYDLMRANVGITDKLGESSAYRLELGGTTRQGTLDNINTGKEVNNRNRWFARGQVLWDLNDDASFRLIVDAARTNEQCCAAIPRALGTSSAAVNAIAAMSGLVGWPAFTAEGRTISSSPNRPYTEAVKDSGISGELNWDTSVGKFTSITAYRSWDTTRGQDVDFSGIDRAYRDGFKLGFDTFTQEFRLNGEKGKLNWLVGAYYSNEKSEFYDTVRFGADAARYVDALAMGTDINGSAAGGTGFQVFGSLGAGSGRIFAAALTPGLTSSFVAVACGAAPNPVTPAYSACVTAATIPSTVAAGNVATAYANSIAAAAPASGTGQQNEFAGTDSTSISLFTHNLIDLTDNDTLTLGLRYNSDQKDTKADLNSNTAACAALRSTTPIGGTPVTAAQLTTTLLSTPLAAFVILACNPVVNTVANGTYAGSRKETAWNGVVSYAHDFSKNLMVYGTYSRGYKSGGYNLDRSAFAITPASQPGAANISQWEFLPEFVDNIELGWKWEGLPGRTTLNGAIFSQKVTDFQYNAFNGFNFQNINIPTLQSRGLEVDLTMRPLPGWTVKGGLLLNDVYVDGAYSKGSITIADGKKLPGQSDTVLTGAIGYKGALGGTGLGWSAYIDTRYESGYSTQSLNALVVDTSQDQGAYTISNARVGFGAVDGAWAIEGWVKNLTDVFYTPTVFGVPEQNTLAGYPNDPRTYGVTIRASF